jgi:hypothetical protein
MARKDYLNYGWQSQSIQAKPKVSQWPELKDEFWNTNDIALMVTEGEMLEDGYEQGKLSMVKIIGGMTPCYIYHVLPQVSHSGHTTYDVESVENGKMHLNVAFADLYRMDARDIAIRRMRMREQKA